MTSWLLTPVKMQKTEIKYLIMVSVGLREKRNIEGIGYKILVVGTMIQIQRLRVFVHKM